jgi:hypothetical protein
VTGDPHSAAYRVLFNDDSQRIARNLKIGKAHEAAVCLACHAVDADKIYHGEVIPGRAHAEGVACDGCHGPSGAWLSAHYQPWWKTLSEQEKTARFGFAPTKNLVSRTLICAGCHVGQPGRDVNHDLIAAGHPRLTFEYTKYHYNPHYNKHWTEPALNPVFELRAWYIGQVTALRATVNLLAHRAQQAKTDPWPELSEWSCYSCHQGLDPDFLRSTAGARLKGRPAGVPGWQVWYSALIDVLPEAAAVCAPGVDAPPLLALSKLRSAMERTNPQQSDTAKFAAEATAELDTWIAALAESERSGRRPIAIPAKELVRLGHLLTASALTADHTALRDYDWDYAGQHALALTAIYHAAGGSQPGSPVADWQPALKALRESLAFPKKPGHRYDSPKGYDPRRAAEWFRQLHTLTDTGKGLR